MLRRTSCAGLILLALGERGERIEAVHREGVEIVVARRESLRVVMTGASASVNGEEVPSDGMDESHYRSVETTIRWRDRILAMEQDRPTSLRRDFEELREVAVEDGDASETRGPLEGRVLVLEERGGEVMAELEDDGEKIDEQYLEGHRLRSEAEAALPNREVSIGDSWEVEGDALRELLGVDASGPALFEYESEEDLFRILGEGSSFAADVEFAAVEDREGLRCAVLAFTYELEAEQDVTEAMGMQPPAVGELSCVFDLDLRGEGRLWWSIDEGRPVAMEHSFDGTLEVQQRTDMTIEGEQMLMQDDTSCTVEGKGSSEWSPVD